MTAAPSHYDIYQSGSAISDDPFFGARDDIVAWTLRREPVLRLTRAGFDDAQIAEALGISPDVVADQRATIFQDLRGHGIVDPDDALRRSLLPDYQSLIHRLLADPNAPRTVDDVAELFHVDPVEIGYLSRTAPNNPPLLPPTPHSHGHVEAPATEPPAPETPAVPSPAVVDSPDVPDLPSPPAPTPDVTAERRAELFAARERARAFLATGPGPLNVGLTSPNEALTLRLVAEGFTFDEIAAISNTAAATHQIHYQRGSRLLPVGEPARIRSLAELDEAAVELIERGATLEDVVALPYLQRSVIERLADLPAAPTRGDVKRMYRILEEELGLGRRYIVALENKAYQHLGLLGNVGSSRAYIRHLLADAPTLYDPLDDPLIHVVAGVSDHQRLAMLLARESLTDTEIVEAMNHLVGGQTFTVPLVRALLRNGQNQLADVGITVLVHPPIATGGLTRLHLPPLQQYLVRRLRQGAGLEQIAGELGLAPELMTTLVSHARQLLNADDADELLRLTGGHPHGSVSGESPVPVSPPSSAHGPVQAGSTPDPAPTPRTDPPSPVDPPSAALPPRAPIAPPVQIPSISWLITPDQNTVLVMRAWGYADEEIASITHIPVSKVKPLEIAGLERLGLILQGAPASAREVARNQLRLALDLPRDPRLPIPRGDSWPVKLSAANRFAAEVLAESDDTGHGLLELPGLISAPGHLLPAGRFFALSTFVPLLLREGLPITEIARLGAARVEDVVKAMQGSLRLLNIRRGRLGRFSANSYMPSTEFFQLARGTSFARQVADLPPLQRDVVRMRAAGHTDEQIAAQLGLTQQIVVALEAAAHQHLGLTQRYASYTPTDSVRRQIAAALGIR
ncbi:hypothetical protein LLS1_24260 [Leifsonia sp. LS1]|uniref:hypothetical protein n=1 Tax=Leifsonia sp. LS1 TaxID=2828483 RepID=UPI001CFF14C4|nr:hypothetical protein [Leifsonia sp. LS1]GIT80757.1 hypothetical protein LLS1_24260 [Leifsonia sp. LS1]